MPYPAAYELQVRTLEGVIAGRAAAGSSIGTLLCVEHDPVITMTRKAVQGGHLIAPQETLAREGIAIHETDRGGDITYHGPGQVVMYPILDLNALNLGLHDYMRMLEDSIIASCARFGLPTMRDPAATGVWTVREGRPYAKVCAMGVRVRRWVSMHGLAINVRTDLRHFQYIVPCGLVGRPVTSLHAELGDAAPSFSEAASVVAEELLMRIRIAADAAEVKRAHAAQSPTES